MRDLISEFHGSSFLSSRVVPQAGTRIRWFSVEKSRKPSVFDWERAGVRSVRFLYLTPSDTLAKIPMLVANG